MVNLLALGPIELWSEGRQHPLGSLKERCVLAVLLHARGEPVSMETVAACVWDDGEPPQDTVGNIRTYISRLNKRLRKVGDVVRVERCSPGRYRLRAAPGAVDLTCFRDLRTRARAAVGRHDAEEAIALLREAEALWRGEPLREFGGDWAKPLSHRLHEDLLRVKEERISLELALGGHADLVGELHELVARNPFAQRAVGFLMKALYRSGRHADALDVYRNTYRLLGERLGIRPDAGLQRLNRQIIDQDPELDREAQPPAGATARRPAAAGHDAAPGRRAAGTLPRDTAEFTGRTGQLAILLAESGREDDGEAADAGTSLPLTVVYGMAGIGKTATAVRAAYRLRERYPDGQFYVDLRGYSEQSRCEPREALALLLGSCGAATDLPDSLDERAARWREWTARHRALVVLDNARATYQVNPLLPGAPTCRAIVTSRNRLSGLDGATPVFLDVLSLNEGMELFTRIAGAARTRDRVTLSHVVDACGRHPLAIQLLAGRYRHRDSWDLEHLLERLTEAQDPLEEFDEALTAAFQLSYAELDGRSQHLLRLLALRR
jgi:DNA-binding SARP family transcriptional activator